MPDGKGLACAERYVGIGPGQANSSDIIWRNAQERCIRCHPDRGGDARPRLTIDRGQQHEANHIARLASQPLHRIGTVCRGKCATDRAGQIDPTEFDEPHQVLEVMAPRSEVTQHPLAQRAEGCRVVNRQRLPAHADQDQPTVLRQYGERLSLRDAGSGEIKGDVDTLSLRDIQR
jgi:hypothetical protein